MRIVHAERTDIGRKRDNNEDNYLAFPEQALFAVFDGWAVTRRARWRAASPSRRCATSST